MRRNFLLLLLAFKATHCFNVILNNINKRPPSINRSDKSINNDYVELPNNFIKWDNKKNNSNDNFTSVELHLKPALPPQPMNIAFLLLE